MGLWNKIVTESGFWKQSVREGMILQSSLNLLLLTWGTPLSEKRGKYKFWRGNERSEQFQLHAHNRLKHYLCMGIDPQVGAVLMLSHTCFAGIFSCQFWNRDSSLVVFWTCFHTTRNLTHQNNVLRNTIFMFVQEGWNWRKFKSTGCSLLDK